MKETMLESRSPYQETFPYELNEEAERSKIDAFVRPERKTVVVQGLGFVGSAVAAALANARDTSGSIVYNVIGLDLADENSYWKIARTNEGKPPIVSSDKAVDTAFENGRKNGNLMATWSHHAFTRADVVTIDINLDIHKKELGNPFEYDFSYDNYKKAIGAIADAIAEDTLVIVESTVPPGTTEQVIYPVFEERFRARGLDIGRFYLAHSYERVMPGPNYLGSITDFYRVYSGINAESRSKTREFLESFTNTKDFPLSELASVNASETAKVLENSFRATNIAFIQEWTEFAEKMEIDLFEVIDAIRVRPTHRNIMLPGFGVGGYCLTKDALLADWSYRNLFDGGKTLGASLAAVATNDLMPAHTFRLLKERFPDLDGVRIRVFGVSYLNDVADTRHTPTELFYDMCTAEKAVVAVHDPLVEYWEEKELSIDNDLGAVRDTPCDVAVFAVRHSEYSELAHGEIKALLPGVQLVIDANGIIDDKTAEGLVESGIAVVGVGKGHWKRLKGRDG